MNEPLAMDADSGRQSGGAEAPDIVVSFEAGAWPETEALESLAARAVAAAACAAGRPLAGHEVSLVLTNDSAIRRLNARWRGRDRATNVLSFPQDGGPLLGDVVLAYETVAREAALAGRPLEHHIAHLMVHGCLHLLGYDHEDETEAEHMEGTERAALAMIGIADPYARHQTER